MVLHEDEASCWKLSASAIVLQHCRIVLPLFISNQIDILHYVKNEDSYSGRKIQQDVINSCDNLNFKNISLWAAEVRCSYAKMALDKIVCGKNTVPGTRLDLMGYKRSTVCPNAISGMDCKVRLIHANGAKVYPQCLVAS